MSKYATGKLIGWVFGLALLVTAFPAAAQEEKPLKEIMQGMLADMEKIVAGIMREDYPLIATTAEGIAYHGNPPPAARMKMARELRLDAMAFKLFDDAVRRYASELQEAALAADRNGVVEAYGNTVKACTACHASYRERIRHMKN